MSFDSKEPRTILYENRILFLSGEINEGTVNNIVPMLLVMDSLGPEPIKLYINSPGGEVSAGLAIYDTMQMIQAPVYTICIGGAASMAAWLLAAGEKGHRIASENARIMIHQGRTAIGGTLTDLKISMDEFSRSQERMVNLLARHCGKTPAEIKEAIERDRWLAPEQAVEFGIVDRVARTAEARRRGDA